MSFEVADDPLFSDVEDFDAPRTIAHAEDPLALGPGDRADGLAVLDFEEPQDLVVVGVPGVNVPVETHGDEVLVTPVEQV